MSAQSEVSYFLSLLSPVDLATMIALAAIMLLVNREEGVTLRHAYRVMVAVGIPLLLWAAACKGMEAPPLVRYVGIYVVCGVVLFAGQEFKAWGAALAAGVLLVANVGCTALMR